MPEEKPQEPEVKFSMEEFAKHAAGEEQVVATDEPAEQPTESPDEKLVEKPAEPTPQSTEQQLDDYWDSLKEEGYEIPEFIKTGKKEDGSPLTKKEKYEALREYILDGSQFGATEEDDAFVREYMIQSSQKDFDRKKWLKDQMERSDILELPSKEFMRKVLESQAKQNGFDWTADDIESKLSTMSKVDLDMQAKQYKANMKAYQDQQQKAKFETTAKEYEKKLEMDNKVITDGVKKWINENREKRRLGGFEFDSAEADELFKELPTFMEKKLVTLPNGQQGMYSEADLAHAELLSDDEKAMRFSIYLMLYKKGKLEGFISDKLDQKKKQIEKTLDDSPEDNSTGLAGETGFDKRSFIKAAQGRGG